jgi:hypothetical protein
MKVKVLSSTIIVSLIICGEKFLIFNKKSEEGKNIKRREWKNFKAGEQFSTSVITLTPRHNSYYSLL